ncbi:hypothetical protein Q5H93_15325 [Hymenobacter sp. ASUV-10]|uniref:Uncharacterized protein n=1 Tax=Hymenobacter aranciens TaxID=3063996 RepID=A0ABT9BEJ3_9BACT|nr:hypothetical protein [Hymenobacter sp. ASUV-10]MDO7876114.1 hypothetical protein [Hymenobacter sp. ASUV-10]
MKKHLLLVALFFAASFSEVLAQDQPGFTMPSKSKTKSKTAAGAKSKSKTNAPIVIKKGDPDDDVPPIIVSRLRMKNPIIVYYEQAPPGKAVQQLIMEEDHLALLRYLSPDQLVSRREVYVDGVGNLGLPGTDEKKYRLLGTNLIADPERKPAGDGRSTYSKLKIPSPGELFVVRESAEEYRHFVKGPQKQGALLDFQVNALPGVDSVRAVYTLRRMDSAERGAGSGSTIR